MNTKELIDELCRLDRLSAIEVINELTDGRLLEQAFQRRKVEDRISGMSESVIQHAIKLVLMPDAPDAKHWANELAGFASQVSRLTLKPDGRPVHPDDVRNWLWDEPMEPNLLHVLASHVNDLSRDYGTTFESSQELFDKVKAKVFELFNLK